MLSNTKEKTMGNISLDTYVILMIIFLLISTAFTYLGLFTPAVLFFGFFIVAVFEFEAERVIRRIDYIRNNQSDFTKEEEQ